MGKLPSLNHQMLERIKSLDCIGQSKHQAKQEYKQYCEENNIKYNPSKTVGIHSYSTFESYKNVSKDFIKYLKQEYPTIKDIKSISKDIGKEYLINKQDSGNSSYSISLYMSALNKLFNFDINKRDAGLKNRSYKGITRSRTDKKHDSRYDEGKYTNQILIAKATGCRRQSISEGQYPVKKSSFWKDTSGNIFCSLIEKGGRFRNAPILNKYKGSIEKFIGDIKTYKTEVTKEQFKENYKKSGEKLFSEYSKYIDNHYFRGQYAKEMYKQVNKKNSPKDYRGYNKNSIMKVSKCLGHNRPSVVVEHYLT